MNRIILNETSYFGAGCRSVIAVEAARRGFKKAFFVTDKALICVFSVLVRSTSNLRNISGNQTILRIIGDRPSMENAVRVPVR